MHFILSLLHQSTSTCFRHICSPSSGGMLHIYNNWYVLCFSVDCLLAAGRPAGQRSTDSQLIVHQVLRRHSRCVWKTNSELNSVRKYNYSCMLDNGIYQQVNNYMFRPIAAIFRLLQFCSKSVIYIYIYVYIAWRY